ncbi:MAG: prepilin-type N-terminal cleavage/methylation domain-containing protein [Haliea sp.]|jgi:prepilin-type N-terminal cleavage/methylation domain-containing protein|nr:prepilin-type N-terminal cleavage/methylation domain-containing protein [Haliea sp.]
MNPTPNRTHAAGRLKPTRQKATGLSLIELMISLVIGVILLLGGTSVFLSLKKAAEVEKIPRQSSDGRTISNRPD